MADRGDRLILVDEVLDEGHRLGDDPQLVGVGGAARQHQRIELVGVDGQVEIDRDLVARVHVLVHRLDGAGPRRHHLHVGLGGSERPHRLHEFDLLDAVRREDRDLQAFKIGGHRFHLAS